MTAELSTSRAGRSVSLPGLKVLPVVLGLVVLVRLMEARSGASPDEGGFLVVAGQWHAGGTSLYGNYWVDRPPLLMVLFRIADLFGGLPALRILGTLAAVATVALLASTARRASGRRAAAWTAIVAGALLVSPLYGAVDVNGELLAAPFLALGFRAAVEAVESTDATRSRAAALLAGVAAVSALMIKQNMADVIVFAAACWIVAWRTRRITGKNLLDRTLLAVAGFAAGYALIMLWAMAHGTAPLDVYQATYPFRIEAAHVIAASGSNLPGIRLGHLVSAFGWSAGPLVLAGFAVFGIRRSRQPAIAAGLALVLAFDTFSVLLGGSYWLHYLIESIPALALAAGATSLTAPRYARGVTAFVAASAVVAAGFAVFHPTPTPGSTIGTAIARSAEPGDTLFSAFGDADILRTTGMSSPYPYLWSLPSRVLDPDLTLLRGVLAGPAAPTWIVVRGPNTVKRLAAGQVQELIEQRYRKMATICGRSIYLLDGRQRPAPVPRSGCGRALSIP